MLKSECKTMIQIMVADDNDDNKEGGEDHQTSDEIVLDQLVNLVLIKLPCLANFYLGHNVMRLPNLRCFSLSDCLHMQKFCKRDISTLKLKEIFLPSSNLIDATDFGEFDDNESYPDDDDDNEFSPSPDDESHSDNDEDDKFSQSSDNAKLNDEDILELIDNDINVTIRHLQQSSHYVCPSLKKK